MSTKPVELLGTGGLVVVVGVALAEDLLVPELRPPVSSNAAPTTAMPTTIHACRRSFMPSALVEDPQADGNPMQLPLRGLLAVIGGLILWPGPAHLEAIATLARDLELVARRLRAVTSGDPERYPKTPRTLENDGLVDPRPRLGSRGRRHTGGCRGGRPACHDGTRQADAGDHHPPAAHRPAPVAREGR
jgi:hypothetical protein